MAVIGATQLEPVNVLGSFVQGMEIGRANRLARQQEAAAQAQAVREAEMRNYLATADLSTPEAQNRLLQFGPVGAEIAKNVVTIGAQRAQASKADYEAQSARLRDMYNLVSSATDAPSYARVRQTAAEMGIDVSNIPEQYDPGFVQQAKNSVLTAAERLDAEIRRGTLDVQRRQAAVSEREVGVKEAEQRRKATTPAEGELDPKIKRKREELYPKAVRSTNQAVRDIDNQIALAKRLRDHEGLASITGGIEGRLPSVREKATAAQSDLDTLLARGTLRSLTELRAASETGGALGNVSNQDTTLLRDSVAALNQSQGKETFRDRLDDYIRDLEFAKDNVQSAFNETYSYRSAVAGETPTGRRRGDPSLRKGSEVMDEADRILGIK